MLRKTLTLIILMLSLAVSATDVTFKEGVNNITVKDFSPINGVFTPNRDGKVVVECQAVWNVVYDNVAVQYEWTPGSGYMYRYEVNDVKANTPVSISLDFVLSNTYSVKITMYGDGPVPVEVLNVSPKTGKTFDWNTTGMVSVNFNKTVTVSSIKFVVGDYSDDVDDVHLGSSLGFNITNALNKALKDSVLQAGAKFQIQIKGLREAADKNNRYNGTGDLTLEYVAPHPQHDLVSARVGESQLSYLQANTYEFLSYYSPDQEDGLFVFEFDGNVGKLSGVTLSMGNLDLDTQGKYYRGAVPYVIEGNKILVDARGTLRTLAVLFPAIVEEDIEEEAGGNEMLGTFDTEHISLLLSNVMDTNGNAFRCNAQGSVGSFSFVMNYREIVDEAYIDGDNKQEGDTIYAGEEISLWLSNADIKFDGLEVSYFVQAPTTDENDEEVVLEQRQVLVKEVSVEPDPFQGVIISFQMPELTEVVVGSTIRVALHDAKSADGMPHYLYIEFKAGVETENPGEEPPGEDGDDSENPGEGGDDNLDNPGESGGDNPDDSDAVSKIILNESGKLYRLDGKQVKNPTKGIYIQNGKKVVLK